MGKKFKVKKRSKTASLKDTRQKKEKRSRKTQDRFAVRHKIEERKKERKKLQLWV